MAAYVCCCRITLQIKNSGEVIFQVVPHAGPELFRVAVFEDINQFLVRYEGFQQQLFFQQTAVVHIIKYRQQHFLKLLQRLIIGDLI